MGDRHWYFIGDLSVFLIWRARKKLVAIVVKFDNRRLQVARRTFDNKLFRIHKALQIKYKPFKC